MVSITAGVCDEILYRGLLLATEQAWSDPFIFNVIRGTLFQFQVSELLRGCSGEAGEGNVSNIPYILAARREQSASHLPDGGRVRSPIR